MTQIELIRTVIGIFFIIYGLGFCAYEKFHDMKYIDQINGVINGFVCIVVGVLISAYNIKQGILVGAVSLILWGVEKIILEKIAIKKNNRQKRI
ncbi:hypothetical protein [Paraclostridium bifermentans]|uniref:hypothetical protein n=1 Tax=Paraclostridium bifermentans TaxID=1490 RepID=UPI00359C2B41